jgi:DNA-binding NtrC family response regulator
MAEAKVLLVDDEVDFTALLAERMESRGLNVVTAPSGAAALELIEHQSFDAIILDMVMPEMDGMETLRRMLEQNPQLQIIMLTGYADLQKGIEAIKKGAVDYLEKPADLNDLMQKIKHARDRKMELFEQKMEEKISKIMRNKGW